jgi:hypothetical protein
MLIITARLIKAGPMDNRGTTVNLAHKFDGDPAIGGMIVSGPFIPYGQQFFRCFSLQPNAARRCRPTRLRLLCSDCFRYMLFAR